MSSQKQPLDDDLLIELLERQRCTFTDRYRPLLTAQEMAVRKADKVITESPELLKRNYSKKKANSILNDIKNCIGDDVYLLCALGTNHSALGASKLGDYVSKIGIWWEGVHHPRGLAMVSQNWRTPKTSLSGDPTSSELIKLSPISLVQHATNWDAQLLIESEPLRTTTDQLSFGAESSIALLSPQDPICPAAQPSEVEGSQHGTDTGDQRSRVPTSSTVEPTPQNQVNMGAHCQTANEQLSNSLLVGLEQIPSNGRYLSFSFLSRHMIENLPEPFRTGMMMSNLWRQENDSGGLAVSNCLTLYLPETNNEDSIFTVKLGYDYGFNLFHLLGLGDPIILAPSEGAGKETGQ